ncbi:MAG: hypothetical protein COA88_09555 [Kordia sp.]|nr:MAG: hypothetical protein COA88_09555 [Kordia sp.]
MKKLLLLLLFVAIFIFACSNDESSKENEVEIINSEIDSDGDGISDDNETNNGTDLNDPCDPVQIAGYTAYTATNQIWAAADCDGDGEINIDEHTNSTDPYDTNSGNDTDGDGISDDDETNNSTDLNDPCDPVQIAGYTAYTATNQIWAAADCDGDGQANINEHFNGTDPYDTNSGNNTVIVPITNPVTGKIWMDRNLGASQAATSPYDAASYGYLYQWGRGTDGHQRRTSNTMNMVSSSDTPGHNVFIIHYTDWRSPQNDNLWQGVNGVNNPCPSEYRLPTVAELQEERLSWDSDAFASPLKLPFAGSRNWSIDGSIYGVGTIAGYWSSTVSNIDTRSQYLRIFSSGAGQIDGQVRGTGFSVRCIKD